MKQSPVDQYQSLMEVVRLRLDAVAAVGASSIDPFSKAEICAFHGRKIIEAIAFGCLVAVENGLKHVPRDAKGQWNAEAILDSLLSKRINVFPSPSIIRAADADEQSAFQCSTTIEGQPDRRMTHNDLKAMYREMHKWLHELNPYVETGRESFVKKHEGKLWTQLGRIEKFVERHAISIGGEMFFCVLRDRQDGRTKVVSLSKVASLLEPK